MEYLKLNFQPVVSVIVRKDEFGACEVVGVETNWRASAKELVRIKDSAALPRTDPARSKGIEFIDSLFKGASGNLERNPESLRALAQKATYWQGLKPSVI